MIAGRLASVLRRPLVAKRDSDRPSPPSKCLDRVGRKTLPAPTTAARNPRALVSKSDIPISVLLLCIYPITLKPPESWPEEAREITKGAEALFPSEFVKMGEMLPRRLPELCGTDRETLIKDAFSAYVLQCIEVFAAYLGRYVPTDLRLEGRTACAKPSTRERVRSSGVSRASRPPFLARRRWPPEVSLSTSFLTGLIPGRRVATVCGFSTRWSRRRRTLTLPSAS